jgi:hypothetical protein
MQLERSKLQLSFETYSEKASLKCICLLKTYLVNSLFQIIEGLLIRLDIIILSKRQAKERYKTIAKAFTIFNFIIVQEAQLIPWHCRLNQIHGTAGSTD